MRTKILWITLLCMTVSTTAFCQKKKVSNSGKKATPTAQTKQTPKKSSMQNTFPAPESRVEAMEELPEFDRTGGKPFFDILREKSNFPCSSPEVLEPTLLSKMLWTASGICEAPETYTALYTNTKPYVDVYLVNNVGLFKYDRNAHKLVLIKHSRILENLLNKEGEGLINASTFLFYAYDPKNIEINSGSNPDNQDMLAGIECGAIMQNVNLFCANEDLACQQVSINDANKETIKKDLQNTDVKILFGQAISRR